MSRNSFDFLMWRGKALNEAKKYSIFNDSFSAVDRKIIDIELKEIKKKLFKIAKKELEKEKRKNKG